MFKRYTTADGATAEYAHELIVELEALSTRLALDKADLACALAEQRQASRGLEEKLSELQLQKDEAEDVAARQLW